MWQLVGCQHAWRHLTPVQLAVGRLLQDHAAGMHPCRAMQLKDRAAEGPPSWRILKDRPAEDRAAEGLRS